MRGDGGYAGWVLMESMWGGGGLECRDVGNWSKMQFFVKLQNKTPEPDQVSSCSKNSMIGVLLFADSVEI